MKNYKNKPTHIIFDYMPNQHKLNHALILYWQSIENNLKLFIINQSHHRQYTNIQLQHDTTTPAYRIYPQLCCDYRMIQLNSTHTRTISIPIYTVASIPTDERSVRSVFELDYVACYPTLLSPSNAYLENDLRLSSHD